MANILTQILEKIGKKYEELSPEAKQTYDSWEQQMAGKPMTPERMAGFLKAEIERNTALLTRQDVRLHDHEDLWLKMAIQRDKLFLAFINETPDQAAKKLESYLKQKYNIV